MVLLTVLAAAPAPLEVSRLVQAPPAEVFRAFTTKEGLVRFLAPDVRFTLAANGPFEALFVPDAPAGQKGGEGCVVKS
ncbi:MAG: SRPBCC domain-containing protein, partial [Myxococcaceae bacterium]